MSKLYKKFLPIKLHELISNFNDNRDLPYEVVLDLLKWNEIYKSRASLTFYDKRKSWNRTENETIRISDHWNFKIDNYFYLIKNKNVEGFDPDYIHSKTDIELTAKWAMGVYDRQLGVYKIIKQYDEKENNYEKLLEIKNHIKTLPKFRDEIAKFIPSEETINKRKALKKLMNNNKVIYQYNGENYFIKNINNNANVIGCVSEYGDKCRFNIKKDAELIIENKIYDKNKFLSEIYF